MSIHSGSYKYIVAAILFAVGFSAPLSADDAMLDRLFEDLAVADEATADRIVGQIYTEWGKSGSATVDLLLKRGQDALDVGDPQAAIEHLTAAIDHAPEFAEPYSARAAAYYLLGMTGPAIEDLRHALVLNPRHFIALHSFAVLLEEMGRDAEALEVYEQVLAIFPADPEARSAADRLHVLLDGQTL